MVELVSVGLHGVLAHEILGSFGQIHARPPRESSLQRRIAIRGCPVVGDDGNGRPPGAPSLIPHPRLWAAAEQGCRCSSRSRRPTSTVPLLLGRWWSLPFGVFFRLRRPPV